MDCLKRLRIVEDFVFKSFEHLHCFIPLFSGPISDSIDDLPHPHYPVMIGGEHSYVLDKVAMFGVE